MPLIPLTTPIKARHPDTGKQVSIIGVDLSSAFGPKLVVIKRGPDGIWADLVEYCDEEPL